MRRPGPLYDQGSGSSADSSAVSQVYKRFHHHEGPQRTRAVQFLATGAGRSLIYPAHFGESSWSQPVVSRTKSPLAVSRQQRITANPYPAAVADHAQPACPLTLARERPDLGDLKNKSSVMLNQILLAGSDRF